MFNDAKLGQGSREGIYEETTLVNGNPAWVSTTGNAIWKSGNRWYFGATSWIGSTTSWIGSALYDNPECPDQASSWRVYKSGEWVDAASGDVLFECYEFKGNIYKQQRYLIPNILCKMQLKSEHLVYILEP